MDTAKTKQYCARDCSLLYKYAHDFIFIVFRFARIYLECDESFTGDPQWDIKGDSAGKILHYVRKHKINTCSPAQ